jgi:hypothetical protein
MRHPAGVPPPRKDSPRYRAQTGSTMASSRFLGFDLTSRRVDTAVSRLDSHQLTIRPKAMATLMSARRYSQSVEPQHRVGGPFCNVQ